MYLFADLFTRGLININVQRLNVFELLKGYETHMYLLLLFVSSKIWFKSLVLYNWKYALRLL
jgi:hypothetical protein